MCGERQQNAAGDIGTICGKGQAGQRNHSIPSPIAEPVLAGNDRPLTATLYDELVRRNAERPHEAVISGTFKKGTPALNFALAQGIRHCGKASLRRSNQSGPRLPIEIKYKHTRVKKILLKFQPALAFHVVLKVPVPVPARLDLSLTMTQIKRRQTGVWRKLDRSRRRPIGRIERVINMGCVVVVAKCDQRCQLQRAGSGASWSNGVLYNCTVLAMHHEDRFLQL